MISYLLKELLQPWSHVHVHLNSFARMVDYVNLFWVSLRVLKQAHADQQIV